MYASSGLERPAAHERSTRLFEKASCPCWSVDASVTIYRVSLNTERRNVVAGDGCDATELECGIAALTYVHIFSVNCTRIPSVSTC